MMLEQACPSCRTNKYNNPQMRLMVNVCGHLLCENCVEVLFVRGSGLCFECRMPLRKSNFRYQLFEDPFVQNEVELRKRILTDFNKREDDFSTLEEYDLYLEKIEEIIFNLMNDVDVEETKRYIELYKKENKDSIKRNRARPSTTMVFYDTILERERETRERIASEDASFLAGGLLHRTTTVSAPTNSVTQLSTASIPPRTPTPASNLSKFIPPATATSLPRNHQQMPPPTAFPSVTREARYLPPPPSTAISRGPLAPPSATLGTAYYGTNIGSSSVSMTPSQPRPADTLLIPSRSLMNRAAKQPAVQSFNYIPYEVDLWGPQPPLPLAKDGKPHTRWPHLITLYERCIIQPLVNQLSLKAEPSSVKPDPEGHELADPVASQLRRRPRSHVDYDAKPSQKRLRGVKLEEGEGQDYEEYDGDGDGFTTGQEDQAKGHVRPSLARMLPAGASGIGPSTFLERCLIESRCALFL